MARQANRRYDRTAVPNRRSKPELPGLHEIEPDDCVVLIISTAVMRRAARCKTALAYDQHQA
jgi:hypothetical protein